MIIPLKSLVPTADDVLNAELENLGELLIRHLKSCEGKSPVFQHAGLNRGYFIAIMERRNVGWASYQAENLSTERGSQP